MQNSWMGTSFALQNAMVRSIDGASCASSLRTGNVTWIRGRVTPLDGPRVGDEVIRGASASGLVMRQQHLDHVLRLVSDQSGGELGFLKRHGRRQQPLRRDLVLAKVAPRHRLEALGIAGGP